MAFMKVLTWGFSRRVEVKIAPEGLKQIQSLVGGGKRATATLIEVGKLGNSDASNSRGWDDSAAEVGENPMQKGKYMGKIGWYGKKSGMQISIQKMVVSGDGSLPF